MKSLSRVWLLATPWTAAYQAPPSMGFSRREYWSGVPLPSPLSHEVGIFFTSCNKLVISPWSHSSSVIVLRHKPRQSASRVHLFNHQAIYLTLIESYLFILFLSFSPFPLLSLSSPFPSFPFSPPSLPFPHLFISYLLPVTHPHLPPISPFTPASIIKIFPEKFEMS